MAFEITGKLIMRSDTMQKSATFKTREFVIEKTEDIGGRIITNFIKFQCVQDRTTMLDRFNIGDEVKNLFNIKGTKWVKDGRKITSQILMHGEWKASNSRRIIIRQIMTIFLHRHLPTMPAMTCHFKNCAISQPG